MNVHSCETETRTGKDGKERKLPEPSPQQQVGEFFEEKESPEPEKVEPKPEKPVFDQLKIQRQRAVKTCEALMREVDSLHDLLPNNRIRSTLSENCKSILQSLREWK